jgi:hypothetical protein
MDANGNESFRRHERRMVSGRHNQRETVVATNSRRPHRFTFECGYKIVVNLDCIQALQAEVHQEECWSIEIMDLNGSVLRHGM